MIDTNIIEQIKSGVKKLKDNFKNDYRFLKVVTKDEIENFEKQFSIEIPEDFKWFLLNIANGVISNHVANDNLFERIDFSNYYFEEDIYNPSLPFKLTKDFDFKTDEIEDFSNGTIHLVGHGCGCYSFLVVNGEEYGNVWVDNYASNSDVTPEKNIAKSRLFFFEWLNKEIEEKISQQNEFHEIKQKQLSEEKLQISKKYERLKSNFNVSSQSSIHYKISLFEKIIRIFK